MVVDLLVSPGPVEYNFAGKRGQFRFGGRSGNRRVVGKNRGEQTEIGGNEIGGKLMFLIYFLYFFSGLSVYKKRENSKMPHVTRS